MGGGSLNLDGVVSGAGKLDLNGGGVLTLTATNNNNGTIMVNYGISLEGTFDGASQLKTDTLTLGQRGFGDQ